jgi:hypothetical protein
VWYREETRRGRCRIRSTLVRPLSERVRFLSKRRSFALESEATFVVIILERRLMAPGPRMRWGSCESRLRWFKLVRENKAVANQNLYVSPSVGGAPLVVFSILIAAAPAFYHC